MHLFIRCWALPHAHQHIIPIFQMATLRLSVEALAHGSGAGPQVRCWCQLSSPWQLRCAGLRVQPLPVWNLHSRLPESHCLRHVGAPTQQPLSGGKEGGWCGAGTVDLPERSARGGEQKSECLGLGPQQPPSPESSRWRGLGPGARRPGPPCAP